MRREPGARLEHREEGARRIARDVTQGQLRQDCRRLGTPLQVLWDRRRIMPEGVDAPIKGVIERSPLIDRRAGREVDVRFESNTIPVRCGESLGGNLLGSRLEHVEPGKVLAREEFDRGQIGKQNLLWLTVVDTAFAQVEVATGLVALLMCADMPGAHRREFLLEKLL